MLKEISDVYHLEAELLLSSVLKCRREDLIINSSDVVNEDVEKKYISLLERRLNGLSIAYLLGIKEFFGHRYIVDNDVLVPRCDSEILVETVFHISKKPKFSCRKIKIADFGAGSGCLLFSILMECDLSANGLFFESDVNAYRVAVKNMNIMGLANRVKPFFGSWDICNSNVDIIVSNPPYIRASDIRELMLDVRKYEPYIALNGGSNGLVCYMSIFKKARKILCNDGYIVFEIGFGQRNSLRALGLRYGFILDQVFSDIQEIDRCLVFKKTLR